MYLVKLSSGSALTANGLDHARTLARQWSVLREGEDAAWVETRTGLRYVAMVHSGIRRVLAEILPA